MAKNPKNEIAKALLQGENELLARKVESLEERLERERGHRLEDRFIALIIILALIDIILLSGAVNVSVGLIVLFLEIIFVFTLAKRMGVKQLAGILDGILNAFARKRGEN